MSDHRVRTIIAAIEKAALEGKYAPSNVDIMIIGDFGAPNTASGFLKKMEQAGLIKVARFGMARAIEVVTSGLRTAVPPGAKPHWRFRDVKPSKPSAASKSATAAKTKPGRPCVRSSQVPVSAASLLQSIETKRVRREGLSTTLRTLRLVGPAATCMFIEGDGWRYGEPDPYCGQPSEEGSSYCAEHHRRCHARVLDLEAAE